jgi:hypothetical protein
MPLIKVEPDGKPVLHRIKLDPTTSAELNLYCAFIGNSNESSVFRAVLKHVFTTDQEFIAWKAIPENLAKSQPRTRRTKTPSNGTDPAALAASASVSNSPTPAPPGARK